MTPHNSPRRSVLVTGGAGYIGSHTCLALVHGGFSPIVIDDLSKGHRDAVEATGATLVDGDTGDRVLLDRILTDNPIAAVLHSAAHAYVGESVTDPARYYHNNFCKSIVLFEAMRAAGITQLVFSSSCATYGTPERMPIAESSDQRPINPYGRSKWFVEQALNDFGAAFGLRSVVLRYFNAAGADPEARLGEDHSPETHLVPLALFAAAGRSPVLELFGTDYPTPDGSCIRDYVHVSDLASAHVAGLNWLLSGKPGEAFNIGSGRGSSVLEVLDSVRRVTGLNVPVRIAPRRPGDPPVLVADGTKAGALLGWKPERSELDVIVADAWRWHQRRHLSDALRTGQAAETDRLTD
ncbi:MAG: UDP-glucose 4-epimerase GalE [Betaproteobacteria bacterium]|nr:UDP-glucose 4-epimerase GalE [Betaproteobacteria bacterium]